MAVLTDPIQSSKGKSTGESIWESEGPATGSSPVCECADTLTEWEWPDGPRTAYERHAVNAFRTDPSYSPT